MGRGESFGTILKRWSRTDESLRVLNSDKKTHGCSWDEGGCLPLAIAVHHLLPGSQLAGIASRSGRIEHVGVLHEGRFYDSRGDRLPRSALQYWKGEPGMELPLEMLELDAAAVKALCKAWETCNRRLTRRIASSLREALR